MNRKTLTSWQQRNSKNKKNRLNFFASGLFLSFRHVLTSHARCGGLVLGRVSKMADELKEDTSILEGLLSTTDQLESLKSLDAAFTTNTGSFRQRHVSESVSLERIFLSILA